MRLCEHFYGLRVLKAATHYTIFCRETSDFLSATKNRPVCGSSRCGSDPIFCREEISGMLDPKPLVGSRRLVCGSDR